MTFPAGLRPTALILAAALMAAAIPGAWAAKPRTPLTPLADASLFISPSGEPFRSQPGQPYPVVAWFRQADANKDGRIDRAEFRADAERFFHVLDRNGDGLVAEGEIYYYERALVPEISAGVESSRRAPRPGQPRFILAQMGGGMGGMGGPPGGGEIDPGGSSAGADGSAPKLKENAGPPQGAASYGLLNDAEPVRSADASLEGRIKLSDFLARADHNFDVLDFSARGYLTLDALPETPVQRVAEAAR